MATRDEAVIQSNAGCLTEAAHRIFDRVERDGWTTSNGRYNIALVHLEMFDLADVVWGDANVAPQTHDVYRKGLTWPQRRQLRAGVPLDQLLANA